MTAAIAPVGLPPTIDIRPVLGTDLTAVYAVASMAGPSWYRVCRDGVPRFPDFESALWARVHALEKIVHRSEEVLGVCGFYDVDERSGRGWLEIVLTPGAEALVPFSTLADRCFSVARDRWGLDRLYLVSIGDGPNPLVDIDAPWSEACRLREAVLRDDFYWDLIINAIELDGVA